ncbi:MAG TPA: right-handed parallel beta-helix repeat-containing protein [Anaerolineaceae bacterium]|nr:right-handed parallel beta-helix repeat-containing protein [Anaerolineaceae bacterium]
MIDLRVSLKKIGILFAALILIVSLAQTAGPALAAPATTVIFMVNTTADPGPATCAATCSLRAAIIAANAGGGTAIQFNLPLTATITLASSLPAVTGAVIIAGPGSGNLTIDGAGRRVLTVNSTAHLTLSGVTIRGGNDLVQGGGILVDHGRLDLSDSLVADNLSSGTGAALYNDSGVVHITHSVFSGNHSFHDGAISNLGTLTVTTSLFEDNSSRVNGAIHNYTGASLSIDRSAFTGNDSTQTPGGAILSEGGATLVITNSTFDNNGANGEGADLSVGGTVHITNSTLANAKPVSLSSISAGGSLTLRNTILAAGGSVPNCTIGMGATLDVNAANLAADSACGSATVVTPVQLNLGPLHYDLGPTPVISPLPGSLAIDSGDNTVCAAAAGSPSFGAGGLDQRGVARPQGMGCDVGAVESPVIYSLYLPIVSQ